LHWRGHKISRDRQNEASDFGAEKRISLVGVRIAQIKKPLRQVLPGGASNDYFCRSGAAAQPGQIIYRRDIFGGQG
jgi:hypothetical protein